MTEHYPDPGPSEAEVNDWNIHNDHSAEPEPDVTPQVPGQLPLVCETCGLAGGHDAGCPEGRLEALEALEAQSGPGGRSTVPPPALVHLLTDSVWADALCGDGGPTTEDPNEVTCYTCQALMVAQS